MRMIEVLNRLKEPQHAEWLLNRVMEQILLGKLKHNDLIFDEKAEWHYSASAPTFFYIRKNVIRETEIFQTAHLVGHIQIKNTNYLEIKQDCSCLYSVEAIIYKGIHVKELMKRAMALMKMVYNGMKEEKITQIPDKMGVFLLTSEDSKEEIKEAFRKHLEFLMDDLCSVTSSYKIEKEEMDWLTEKSEIFLEKLILN